VKRRNALHRLVLACAMAFAGRLPAQDMAELDVDHALTLEVETPHTDWAQPYALGPTRVLFFCNGRGTVPRECVELMQRFDINAEAVFWTRIVDSSETHWHGGETGERRMLSLLEQTWDCFVFLGLDMSKMVAEQQYKILKPVASGAGIVFVESNDPRVLKKTNQVNPLPPFLQTSIDVEAYAVGAGRGIRLPKRPPIGYRESWQVEYDYWAEALGRTIMWAAGKAPAAELQVTLSASEADRGNPQSATARFKGKLPGGTPTLVARIRGEVGAPIELTSCAIQSGADMALPLPTLPTGNYHIDAWIRTNRGIETWATVPLILSSQRTVAEVALTQSWGEVGDPIAGHVALQGPPLAGERLQLRLLDRRRRVLRQANVPITGNEGSFSFPSEAWMPMLVTVEGRLLTGSTEIASAYQYYHVTKRHQERFNFLIWDTPKGPLAPYAEQSLVDNSVTLQLGHGIPPVICAAYDVAWVPYTTRIMAKLTPESMMQPFCWNDHAAVERHVKEKARAYAGAREHGVFVWSLGDEVMTKGACLSPHCAEAYRTFLQEQYEGLDALNRSWNTTFASWSDVGLANPEDNEEATSLKAKNYPRWFDRQHFKSWNFVQFCGKYAEAYEAIDPQAKTGFEGAGRFGQGDDIDLIVRSNKFWSPYPGTADEIIRSIAPRHFPRANWMGYTKDADSLLGKYYRMVTRGADSVWWWRWDCIGRFHGWLAPDLRPFPAVKDILQDTSILREGLGDLLLHSQMQHDRIAVLFSLPSTFAHKLDEGATYGGYENAHKNTHTLCRELHCQFAYITERMLRLGEFDPSAYDLLFLPRAEALSRKEAEAIRTFVEQGGMVVADVRPAIYDEHCKARDNGLLDGLFGVQRKGRAEAVNATFEPYGILKMDPTVSLTTGKAKHTVEGIPIFVENRVGKGRTLLLNVDFSTFPSLKANDVQAGAESAATAILNSADIRPPLAIRGADGKREKNVETIRWQNGEQQIVALFRQGGMRSTATVELNGRHEVFDLRNRRTLGRHSSFQTEIIPNRATFFALLKDSQPKIDLELSSERTTRGATPTLVLSSKSPGEATAVRLEVSVGDVAMPWLAQNIVLMNHPVTVPIPVAFNDPVGTYTLTVTEVVTQTRTTTKLSVR